MKALEFVGGGLHIEEDDDVLGRIEAPRLVTVAGAVSVTLALGIHTFHWPRLRHVGALKIESAQGPLGLAALETVGTDARPGDFVVFRGKSRSALRLPSLTRITGT